MEKRFRSKCILAGTLIGAIVVVLFLTWPMFFGGTAPTAVPVASTSVASVLVPGTTSSSMPSLVAATSSVHLLVVAGTSTIIDDVASSLSFNENAFVLLKNAAEKYRVSFVYKTYPGMGDLITQIGVFTNGSGEKYWQYSVNGRYVPVGADDYVLQQGDTVVWEFKKSQE